MLACFRGSRLNLRNRAAMAAHVHAQQTRLLAFRDPAVERTYALFGASVVRLRSKWTCLGFALTSSILGVAEGVNGLTDGALWPAASCRAASVACAALTWFALSNANRWQIHLEVLLVVSWTAQLACAAAAACVAAAASPAGTSPLAPFQWWSVVWCMAQAVLVLASGLRVPLVAALAFLELVAVGVSFVEPWAAPRPVPVLLFILSVLVCVGSAYANEATARSGFAALAQASADRELHERLLEDMLPRHVRALVHPEAPLLAVAAIRLAALPLRSTVLLERNASPALPRSPAVRRWRASLGSSQSPVPRRGAGMDASGSESASSRIPTDVSDADAPRGSSRSVGSDASVDGGMHLISIAPRRLDEFTAARARRAVGSDASVDGSYNASPREGGTDGATLAAGGRQRRVSVLRMGSTPIDSGDLPDSISGAVALSMSSASARSEASVDREADSHPTSHRLGIADVASSRAALGRLSFSRSSRTLQGHGAPRFRLSTGAAVDSRPSLKDPSSAQQAQAISPTTVVDLGFRSLAEGVNSPLPTPHVRPPSSRGRGAIVHLRETALPTATLSCISRDGISFPPSGAATRDSTVLRLASERQLASDTRPQSHPAPGDSTVLRLDSERQLASDTRPPSHPAFRRVISHAKETRRRPKVSNERSGVVDLDTPSCTPFAAAAVALPGALSTVLSVSDTQVCSAINSTSEAASGPLRLEIGPQAQTSSSSLDDVLPVLAVAHHIDEITVVFLLVKNLDEFSNSVDPYPLVLFLNSFFSMIDAIVDANLCYKIMCAGGSYLFVAGGFDGNAEHAATAARAALEIMRGVLLFPSMSGVAPVLQIGLNTGPVAAGIVGSRAVAWSLFGDTVNVASRMCSGSDPFHIQVAPETARILRRRSNNVRLVERGPHFFKGKGIICTCWLSNAALDEALDSRRANMRTPRVRGSESPQQPTEEAVQSRRLGSSNSNPETVATTRAAHTVSVGLLDSAVDKATQVCIPTTAPFNDSLDEASFAFKAAISARRTLVGLLVLSALAMLGHYAAAPFSPLLLGLLLGITFAALITTTLVSPRLSALQCFKVPMHDVLTVVIVVVITLVVNLVWRDDYDNNRQLAAVNFAFLILVSLLGLGTSAAVACYVCVLVTAACVCIIAGVKESSGWILGTELAILLVGTALGMTLTLVNGSPGRDEFIAQRHAENQMARCERLLLQMLPTKRHAQSVMRGETVVEVFHDATMLYSDIRGFTSMTAQMDPDVVVAFLHELYSRFDRHLNSFGLWKIDTIGDATVVLGMDHVVGESSPPRATSSSGSPIRNVPLHRRFSGLDVAAWLRTTFDVGDGSPPAASVVSTAPPVPVQGAAISSEPSCASGSVECDELIDWTLPPPAHLRQPLSSVGAVALFALDMLREVEKMSTRYADVIDSPLEIRIGIHTGTVVGGIIGLSRPHFEIWGQDTLIAQRLESGGMPSMIHVSLQTARKLYFEGFCLHPRQPVPREKAEGRGARPPPHDAKAFSAATAASHVEARPELPEPGESQHPGVTSTGGLRLGDSEQCVASSGLDSSRLSGAPPPLRLARTAEPGLPGHRLAVDTLTDANSPEQTFFVDGFHFVSGLQRIEVNVA